MVQNDELLQSNLEDLSTVEITKFTKQLQEQIMSLTKELDDKYRQHNEDVELEYGLIAQSTVEFMESIRLFKISI